MQLEQFDNFTKNSLPFTLIILDSTYLATAKIFPREVINILLSTKINLREIYENFHLQKELLVKINLVKFNLRQN